jgi:cyclic pyranopterin phosphate synthase
VRLVAPDRFAAITCRDALGAVLAGIDAALAPGLDPVKVNCVVVRGLNDDEILDFAAFGRAKGVELRFIEWMPLDAGGSGRWSQVVPATEIVAAIDAEWPLVAPDGGRRRDSAPAESYRTPTAAGRVGVIASVTRPFCESCDRIRLTAEGQLRNCLFSVRETDLRGHPAGRGDRRRPGHGHRGRGRAQVGRVTRSGRSTSSARPAA